MITSRDYMIVEFLEEFKIANTNTISTIFFPSLSACQKRLKVMYESGIINRIRDNVSSEYLYFIKKIPKQLKHSLLVCNFYGLLKSKCDEIVTFKIEPALGDIKPDALFGYRVNGKGYLGLLEVEISNKGFNWDKYNRLYNSGDYKKWFPVMPKLFIIGNNVKFKQMPFEVNIFDTNFNNFRVS